MNKSAIKFALQSTISTCDLALRSNKHNNQLYTMGSTFYNLAEELGECDEAQLAMSFFIIGDLLKNSDMVDESDFAAYINNLRNLAVSEYKSYKDT
jgi:hypothetical protein